MESYEKLNQQKLEVIAKLSKPGLMQYIDKLSRKYYNAFINGDAESCNATLKDLEDIVYMFDDEMDNLHYYVNYSLLKHANIIIKTLYKTNHELDCFEVDMDSINKFGNLSQSIRRSLLLKIENVDKVNIKHLHEMCVVGGTIDENMVEIVNALYYSFNSKDGDADE